jgi:hypothetical protein
MKLTKEEKAEYKATVEELGVKEDAESLHLAVLESIDDVSYHTLRRIFILMFSRKKVSLKVEP